MDTACTSVFVVVHPDSLPHDDAHRWPCLQMADPVCVVVFREPIENAVSLTDNAKKSAAKDKHQSMTPERWLRSWEEGVPASKMMLF